MDKDNKPVAAPAVRVTEVAAPESLGPVVIALNVQALSAFTRWLADFHSIYIDDDLIHDFMKEAGLVE